MNAPLSLYLTRFRRDEVAVLSMPGLAEAEPDPAFEHDLAFDQDGAIEPVAAFEIDAPLVDADADVDLAAEAAQDALREALLAAGSAHADEIAALQRWHDAALHDAVEAARAAWVVQESAAVAALIDTAFSALKTDLANGIAGVLRPMLAQAALDHALRSVSEALDHLVADAEHPTIAVRGPGDLIAALRTLRAASARGGVERIDYADADLVEITIETAGTHVETRLAAALAAIQETGA